MLQQIGMLILRAVYGVVVEAVRSYEMRRAEDRIAALEGYIKSKSAAEAISKDVQTALDNLTREQKKAETLKDKLAAIRKFNGKEQ